MGDMWDSVLWNTSPENDHIPEAEIEIIHKTPLEVTGECEPDYEILD